MMTINAQIFQRMENYFFNIPWQRKKEERVEKRQLTHSCRALEREKKQQQQNTEIPWTFCAYCVSESFNPKPHRGMKEKKRERGRDVFSRVFLSILQKRKERTFARRGAYFGSRMMATAAAILASFAARGRKRIFFCTARWRIRERKKERKKKRPCNAPAAESECLAASSDSACLIKRSGRRIDLSKQQESAYRNSVVCGCKKGRKYVTAEGRERRKADVQKSLHLS